MLSMHCTVFLSAVVALSHSSSNANDVSAQTKLGWFSILLSRHLEIRKVEACIGIPTSLLAAT